MQHYLAELYCSQVQCTLHDAGDSNFQAAANVAVSSTLLSLSWL